MTELQQAALGTKQGMVSALETMHRSFVRIALEPHSHFAITVKEQGNAQDSVMFSVLNPCHCRTDRWAELGCALCPPNEVWFPP